METHSRSTRVLRVLAQLNLASAVLIFNLAFILIPRLAGAAQGAQ